METKMFQQLPDKFTYAELEQEILKFWEENDIFNKTLKNREGKPDYSFYEGPPTVNGKPGLHHLMARTIKDTVCRYKTLSGYYVRRQAGWDTHGLPVELSIEKELGFKDKSEIEEYGIGKFNEICRKSVYKNIEMDEGWRSLTRRMGYWVDLDSAYITCTNDYIESVWWALKEYFDKGYIYKGFKVVPQSPTIETPLSSHELSLGYKDVRDPNCYLMLAIVDSPIKSITKANLVVWTTTPWTLLANVALAVGEDIDYVHVKNVRKDNDEERIDELVLAKSRLSALDGEYTILSEFKGHKLLGTSYNQILPYAKIDKENYPNALTVLIGDFVSTEDGSGIVHLAPAFGEDDYRMSKIHNLPFLQPVTPNGHFTEELGPYAGKAIKTFTYEDRVEVGSDKEIIIELKTLGKIYRTRNDYLHSYPHCWRTGNPIMYYARESWFIKSPEYKEDMIRINKEINWQPPEIGPGRFGNWLEEVKEWSLSRDRFWGTPLPIWVNETDKNDIFAVGSIEQLKQGVYEKEDGTRVPLEESGQTIDLHRPFVDHVVFEKDGNTYRRVHEVIDVWFDSGAMPFAQMHYPFENKELFERQFPGDFIAEGIDQTRGWFYTLHNIAVALFNKPAYKNIVVNELILDKTGVKMSKSKGNTIDPFEIMDKHGADAVRWYLFVNNPPWKATLFNEENLVKTVLSDFFRSLTNTYAFFAMYANIDKFTGKEESIPVDKRPEIDRWIISRINSVVKEYTELMEQYELTKAHRVIQNFTINELSNWYVRRNRRRFWKGENDAEKIAAYQTLREVLLTIVSLMASAAPFLSENLYQRLKYSDAPESIHMSDLVSYDDSYINIDLERRMDLAQKIVILARSLREKSKLRTRQPLSRILIPVLTEQEQNDILSIKNIILEELNIKDVEFVTDETQDIIKKKANPNFKVIGGKYGKNTQNVANAIRNLTNEQIVELENNDTLELQVGDESITVLSEDLEILSQDIEGWLVATDRGVTVALDTHLNDELIDEGIAREFINRIQNLRKDTGFDVTDRISIRFRAEETIAIAILNMSDYIRNETLAVTLENDLPESEGTKLELNDSELFVQIDKL